jgi:hypothetical protein
LFILMLFLLKLKGQTKRFLRFKVSLQKTYRKSGGCSVSEITLHILARLKGAEQNIDAIKYEAMTGLAM